MDYRRGHRTLQRMLGEAGVNLAAPDLLRTRIVFKAFAAIPVDGVDPAPAGRQPGFELTGMENSRAPRHVALARCRARCGGRLPRPRVARVQRPQLGMRPSRQMITYQQVSDGRELGCASAPE